jgi:hypothetical protein
MQYLLNPNNLIMKVNGTELCTKLLLQNGCDVFTEASHCYNELASRLRCDPNSLIGSEFQLIHLNQTWFISKNDGLVREIVGEVIHYIVSIKQ